VLFNIYLHTVEHRSEKHLTANHAKLYYASEKAADMTKQQCFVETLRSMSWKKFRYLVALTQQCRNLSNLMQFVNTAFQYKSKQTDMQRKIQKQRDRPAVKAQLEPT